MQYIETLKDINKGDQTKTVYLPFEATGMLGALGGMKDLVKG